MKIIFDGKVISQKVSKDKKYVNFGDIETFSPVNLGIPADKNLVDGEIYHVEASGQMASGQNGLYFRVNEVTLTKRGGEK